MVVQTLDEEMHVIGHEAVRKNCKPLAAGGYTNLLQGVLDDVRALEDAGAFNRAKRQQIAMNAAI